MINKKKSEDKKEIVKENITKDKANILYEKYKKTMDILKDK